MLKHVVKFVRRRYLLFIILIVVLLKTFGVFTHFFELDYYTNFHYPYDGKILTSVQQLRYNEHPEIPPINTYNFNFTLDCKNKCQSDDGNFLQLRLVLLVKSSPNNFKNRLSIRQTWGYEHRFSDVEIRTVFILGITDDIKIQNKIQEESHKFQDIIQASFIDAYFNNTIKTMMGFKWAVKYCPESKVYMFVDDDYYVSIKNVLRFVRNPTNYPKYLKEPIYSLNANSGSVQKGSIMDFELPEDVKLYTGYVFYSSPLRHFTSKWYVTLEEYPYNLWPPYVTAGAYILSREALHDLYYTSFYTKHFKFDDIYVGLLAKKANIEPFHCDEFYFYKKEYHKADYTFVIASHGYGDMEELIKVWNEQKSLGNT